MLRFRLSRWKILLMAELFLLLILLCGCFQQDRLVASFSGGSMAVSSAVDGNVPTWNSDAMKLTPGVYQVRVWKNAGEGQSCYISMEDDSDSFKALRGNGILLAPEQDYLDYEFYVSNTVSTAYVSCVFYGGTAEMLTRLEIYRLNWGSRMTLIMALVFFAVLDGLLIWRRRILECRVSKTQQFVFWSLAGTALLAYFPYLTDYVIIGDGTLLYLKHIEGLVQELSDGRLPLFYGEGFLWLPVLLRLAGFSVMNVYKFFVLTGITAATVISYFSFKKCMQDRRAALFGAFIYTLNPWYLSTIYNRGAVPEYLVVIFLPLVCCGMYGLYREGPHEAGYQRNKWYIAVGITAILQSSMPFMVSVLCGILPVCVIFWKKTLRRQTLLQLTESIGMVLAMNCWCWIPMLGMLPGVRERLQGIACYDIWSLNLSGQLCAVAGIMAAMLLGFVYKRFQNIENKQIFRALSLSAVVAVAGIAMYKVNDIAFRSQAVRIYTAESMGTIPEVYRGTPIFYIAQAASVISILVLLFWKAVESKKEEG